MIENEVKVALDCFFTALAQQPQNGQLCWNANHHARFFRYMGCNNKSDVCQRTIWGAWNKRKKDGIWHGAFVTFRPGNGGDWHPLCDDIWCVWLVIHEETEQPYLGFMIKSQRDDEEIAVIEAAALHRKDLRKGIR
jgi:hypothetical protein